MRGLGHAAENALSSPFPRHLAKGGKYRPVRIRIWSKDDKTERFPLVKLPDPRPKAQRWLHSARRTLKKLEEAARRASVKMEK